MTLKITKVDTPTSTSEVLVQCDEYRIYDNVLKLFVEKRGKQVFKEAFILNYVKRFEVVEE